MYETEARSNNAQRPTGAALPAPTTVSRRSIAVVLFAALLVNATMVLAVVPRVSQPMAMTYSMSFGDLYDLIGRNLEQGHGYRVDASAGLTMLREPAYPLFLAAAFRVGGYDIQTARVACILLAFGAALMLMSLARKITGNTATALLAALVLLLYPGTIVAEGRAGIELPSIFTIILFMLVLYRAIEKRSTLWYLAAGLLMGLSALVRSQVLLFPLILFVYLIFISRTAAERLKVTLQIAVLGLGAIFVMSPWIIRNYTLVHAIVPSATVAGVAAQEGLYTCENASTGEPFYQEQTEAGLERTELAKQLGAPFEGTYYQIFYTPQAEIAFNRALLSNVSKEYRSHPQLLAGCAAKNLVFNFWFLGKTPHTTLLNMAIQVPLLGLAVAGIVILWKRGLLQNAAVILLYVCYIPLIQSPIIAHTRHSMLILPFLAILAAVSLVSIWRALRT